VNTHHNARLTAWGRAQLVQRILVDHEPVQVVAAALHVSPPTIYKWCRRFRTEGPAGLLDRSSRPRHSPRAVAPRVVQRMIALRTARQTGPAIARTLGVPRATVGRWLHRAGLGRLRVPRPPIVRYQRERPGELVHLDLKALPRFTRPGHRVHGQRTGIFHAQGRGHDYLHVAIDDATRLAYAELQPAQDGPACAAFLQRALGWYAQLGIGVEAIMTDNAFAYTGRAMRAVLTTAHLRHLRTRPYTPRTNGKAERFIQTCLREWAYARPYRTSTHRAQHLPAFLDTYNTARDHSALEHVPPLLAYLMRPLTTS
jgi:transposase InsO family protein